MGIGNSLPIQLNDFLVNYAEVLRKNSLILCLNSNVGSAWLVHNFMDNLVLLVPVAIIIVLLAISIREVTGYN